MNYTSLGDCDPIIFMNSTGRAKMVNKSEPVNLKDAIPAHPCGLVAKSYFNDSYALYY